jgi:hypothetical protein
MTVYPAISKRLFAKRMSTLTKIVPREMGCVMACALLRRYRENFRRGVDQVSGIRPSQICSKLLRSFLAKAQLCRITLSSELRTSRPSVCWPVYWINPILRNRFMKKLTRERVVPTISASLFSLELKS